MDRGLTKHQTLSFSSSYVGRYHCCYCCCCFLHFGKLHLLKNWNVFKTEVFMSIVTYTIYPIRRYTMICQFHFVSCPNSVFGIGSVSTKFLWNNASLQRPQNPYCPSFEAGSFVPALILIKQLNIDRVFMNYHSIQACLWKPFDSHKRMLCFSLRVFLELSFVDENKTVWISFTIYFKSQYKYIRLTFDKNNLHNNLLID